jgi:hypothetical protein
VFDRLDKQALFYWLIIIDVTARSNFCAGKPAVAV